MSCIRLLKFIRCDPLAMPWHKASAWMHIGISCRASPAYVAEERPFVGKKEETELRINQYLSFSIVARL